MSIAPYFELNGHKKIFYRTEMDRSSVSICLSFSLAAKLENYLYDFHSIQFNSNAWLLRFLKTHYSINSLGNGMHYYYQIKKNNCGSIMMKMNFCVFWSYEIEKTYIKFYLLMEVSWSKSRIEDGSFKEQSRSQNILLNESYIQFFCISIECILSGSIPKTVQIIFDTLLDLQYNFQIF